MRAGWLPTLLCFLVFSGCATTNVNRQGWASRKWWPNGRQWRDAATDAVIHPGTWVPAIGAVIIAVGNWDQDISDWAVQERPVFGSRKTAQDASDILCTSAHMGMVATALAVPSDDEPWLSSMAWRMVWEHLGVMAASYATDPLKRWTDRDRPSGGKRSFPSWHASRSAAYAGVGYRNLDRIRVRPAYRRPAQLILTSLVAGTAWARVEASQHYPTDVLAGAAFGNFVAILVHDAFLDRGERPEISLKTDADGFVILDLVVSF